MFKIQTKSIPNILLLVIVSTFSHLRKFHAQVNFTLNNKENIWLQTIFFPTHYVAIEETIHV